MATKATRTNRVGTDVMEIAFEEDGARPMEFPFFAARMA
jgi:hypothetical protein